MIFKALGRIILGLILATIIAGILGALMGTLEVLTGVPFAKAWLSTGLGGLVDVLIYVVCVWRVLRAR